MSVSANGGVAGTANAALTITITGVGLTVTGITANAKVYNGTATASLDTSGAVLVGVLPGANVTLVTGGAVAVFADANVGTAKTVTIAGLTLTGPDAGGYTLTQPTATGNITPASASVTLGSLSATYNASSHAATATTVPASLAVTYTYNGSATAPTAAGSYAVIGTVNNTNYVGTGSGTLVIAPATASVTLGHLTATATGSAVSATATTTPSGLTVTFTYNGSATPPTAAGSYTVVGTISDANYTGSSSGTLTLVAPTPTTVTLGSLSATYNASSHAATATTVPANVTVAITYNGSATAPTNAGSYAVVATVTDPSYSGSANGTLVIAKASQTITFTQPGVVSNSAPVTLSATASSGLPVSFSLVSGPATLSGATLTLADKPGLITVQASQEGNANYLAATPVSIAFGSYLPAPLANVSILGQIDGTQPSIVAGFVIAGSGAKSVLLRGVGPTLTTLGVAGALATPTLQLYNNSNGTVITSNSGWAGSSTLSTLFAQLGAFALASGSVDAAVTASLQPGSYSLVVTGASGTSGLALAEIYDATGNTLSQTQALVNVSSLGQVRTGLPMTAGFVIAGSASRQVLVRGLGPILASFGVAGTITDPTLKLYNSTGVLIASNNDWSTADATVNNSYPSASASAVSTATAAANTFALVSGSKDAAILVTLPPGTYTAQVSGVGGVTGAGMIEIDEVP